MDEASELSEGPLKKYQLDQEWNDVDLVNVHDILHIQSSFQRTEVLQISQNKFFGRERSGK